MQIYKTDTGFSIELSNIESLLISDLIANSYSGGVDWAVSESQYETTFGITLQHAQKLCIVFRSRWKESKSEFILLKQDEKDAIDRIFDYMLSKWDDGDFEAIANAKRSDAFSLLNTLTSVK